MRGEDLATRLDALPIDELTQEERDGLAYMRDEERLAGDVYRELDERWALRTFANIASAEATHTDAVAALLERHGLDDPADGQAAGDYREPAFQALHDELVARGGESIEAALSVGATIEELDISDLRSRASDSADIALVYSNLERGSRNHLRAFVSQLDRRGVTYEPTHLSPAEFDAIVDSDMERGAGG